jgi:hypothetical protein
VNERTHVKQSGSATAASCFKAFSFYAFATRYDAAKKWKALKLTMPDSWRIKMRLKLSSLPKVTSTAQRTEFQDSFVILRGILG